MKKYQAFALAAAIFAIVSLGLAQGVRKSEPQRPVAATQTVPVREAMNQNRLATLLSAVGVTVDERAMLPSRVDTSRDLLLRWNALQSGSRPDALMTSEPESRLLSLVNSRTNNEGLVRQRAFELSPTQVLVVAINRQRQLRWWSLMPDPRVLRAETSDDRGNLSGQTLYRPEADFIVALPDDPSITEVRLYHPSWNGAAFTLERVGEVNLY